MIRKLFCAALALAMVFALAACGASQTPSSTPGATPEGEVISFTRENFPRLDGSTATAPLAQAVAAVLLGESEDEAADLIDFSRTTERAASMAGISISSSGITAGTIATMLLTSGLYRNRVSIVAGADIPRWPRRRRAASACHWAWAPWT